MINIYVGTYHLCEHQIDNIMYMLYLYLKLIVLLQYIDLHKKTDCSIY